MLLTIGQNARAATFGVPTQIGTDGSVCTGNNVPPGVGCTAAALDPPGYLILTGVDDVDAAGDTVHQTRLFIEVTGNTLDVRVFDPGRSGLRDQAQAGNTDFTYRLLNPAGATLKTITIGADSTVAPITENRVVRMSSAAADTTFVALTGGTAFTGLTPGLYELRITASVGTGASPDNDRNSFGVDIRADTAANAAHYNVFTYGLDDDVGQGTVAPAADTSLVIGALQSGTNGGTISQDMIVYPYITRGCSVDASNFDMDSQAGSSGSLTSILGVNSALPVSGATTHAEPATPVTIHTTGTANGVQTDSYNYGLWSLQNDTGSQFNIIDWRLADFRGWADNPANLPRDTTDAFRTYLPNGYTGGVPPLTNATAPTEPVLGSTFAYRSGQNPPAAGQLTRFVVQVQLYNPGPASLGLNAANDQIVSGLPAGATNLGNIRCFQNFTGNSVGTAVNGGTFARCNFSGAGVTVNAGDAVILSYEFDYTPGAAGTFFITNQPAAPAAGTYNNGALAPNSTTWAQYSRFPTGTVKPETLGPICDLRAATGTAVTRATIAGLRVDNGRVEFVTLGQRHTRSFNLYATADASGLGSRALLNASPILSPLPDSTGTVFYHADTGPITAPFLLIEEIETSGRQRMMGPFSVSDPRLRNSYARFEAGLPATGYLARRGARLAAPAVRTSLAHALVASGPRRSRSRVVGVKVEVDDPGQVRVTLAELRAYGLPASLRLSRLRVTSQGSEVPFTLVPGPDGQPEALTFVNRGLATAYTGTNVFIVDWRVQRPRMHVGLTHFDSPTPTGMVRVEKDRYYAPGAPLGSDPWIWDYVPAGEPWPRADDPAAGLFDLPGLEPAATDVVPVRLRLVGVSSTLHTVEASINGVRVGAVTFAGQQGATLVGAIAASDLRSAGNSLTLSYQSESPDGLVYLGHLDLEAPLAGTLPEVTPSRLSAYGPGAPRLLSATDYLIVTHPEFRAQADALASLKSSDGHSAAVIGVEEVYDRYSTGIPEAQAIRQLIVDQAKLGHLKYVLLFGDDSYDPVGHLEGSPVSHVPSLFAWDREFGRIPSETLFSDVDGDGVPDVAIGRLPVRSVPEADAMVAKIARQSAVLQLSARHLFGVDNQLAGDPAFETMAEQAASMLPGADVTWARVAGGTDAARQTLVDTLRGGTRATHFFGHGSPDGWADERVLTVDDMPALADSPETLVFAWACESQWFLYPFGPSLGEALLLLPQGGALASFGPAGITNPAPQSEFLADLYPRFFTSHLTLGEAIQQAKAAAIQRDPGSLGPVVNGWSLLGDPSLRLPD